MARAHVGDDRGGEGFATPIWRWNKGTRLLKAKVNDNVFYMILKMKKEGALEWSDAAACAVRGAEGRTNPFSTRPE